MTSRPRSACVCATQAPVTSAESARRKDRSDLRPSQQSRSLCSTRALPAKSRRGVEAGTPGSSARREFERRKANREERIRAKHPKLGGFIWLSPTTNSPPRHGTPVPSARNASARDSTSWPPTPCAYCTTDASRGTRANIDHIAVTPTGVYVIDAKKYRGRPHLKIEGGLLRPRVEKLWSAPATAPSSSTASSSRSTSSVTCSTPTSRFTASCASSKPTGPDRRRVHHPWSPGPLAEEALPDSSGSWATRDRLTDRNPPHPGRRPPHRLIRAAPVTERPMPPG